LIDSKIIKDNPAMVKEMLVKRNINFPVDDLFDSDKKRRNLIVELQNLKHQKNIRAKEIATAKKRKENISNSLKMMEEIGLQIKRAEDERRQNEQNFLKYINSLPNFPHESVPIGKDETENVVIKRVLTNLNNSFHDTSDKRNNDPEILLNLRERAMLILLMN